MAESCYVGFNITAYLDCSCPSASPEPSLSTHINKADDPAGRDSSSVPQSGAAAAHGASWAGFTLTFAIEKTCYALEGSGVPLQEGGQAGFAALQQR